MQATVARFRPADDDGAAHPDLGEVRLFNELMAIARIRLSVGCSREHQQREFHRDILWVREWLLRFAQVCPSGCRIDPRSVILSEARGVMEKRGSTYVVHTVRFLDHALRLRHDEFAGLLAKGAVRN